MEAGYRKVSIAEEAIELAFTVANFRSQLRIEWDYLQVSM